jgi:O-antigen/teichoic acid export membrane protein
MSLRRILKMLMAFFTAQGLGVITQLLVPPLFLHRYGDGVAVYGEWITLSAAVTYIGSLNYGVQTYAVNQMTIHWNRGEVDECRTVQASALRLLQWIILALMPAAVALTLLPISRWLHLRHATNREGGLVLALLLLQVFATMVFSLLATSFMAVNRAHRGANWMNVRQLALTAVIAGLVWFRASFSILAGSQLAVTVILALFVMLDMGRVAPELVPKMRFARGSVIRGMVKPSSHFSLLSLSAFLVWQAPILLMQRLLGPAAVAVFALTRTVFTMSRQLLAAASQAIAPEITSLVGRKDWQQLQRLYDLSERVVLFLVPTVSVATLMASPFLLRVWLHKGGMYQPWLCLAMAINSAAMGIKEHKFQFQAASNQHTDLSRAMMIAYGSVLLLSTITMKYFGVVGFILTWLVAESSLTGVIMKMNAKLFPAGFEVSTGPVWRLAGLLVIVFAGAAYPALRATREPMVEVLAIGAIYTLVTALLSYQVFGLSDVRQVVLGRWRRKVVRESALP